MRRIGLTMLLCAAVLLIATPGFAGDDSDMAGTVEKWGAAYNAHDFEAAAALYAEDGCRMPPNMATVEGREAILAAMKEGFEQGVAQVHVALTKSMSYGDWAHAVGTYVILDPDGNQVDQGKWMNVSHKHADGWLIQCDIWNSNNPLPMDDEDDD